MEAVLAVSGGRVRGRRDGVVWRFAGVPYAGSPAGTSRWLPPDEPEPWSGVRSALEFGPVAPQTPSLPGAAIPGDPTEQSEDCLTLNVWTPGLDERRRPVMVWFHGGGFTSGSGSSRLYAGDRLAEEGDVVIVTFNYRLGALGFLGHPVLRDGTGGGQGNWGLLDQVAVLRWVAAHIGDFGGDAGNVTVFGESAGAMSVSALLGVPAARGLFHRAIIESGPPYWHSRQRAERAGEDLAAVLGIRPLTRRTLTAVPAADLVAATQVLQERTPEPGELPLPFLPMVGGPDLPRPPEEAVLASEAAGVPVLIGTNRDELTFWGLGDERLANIDEQGLYRWVARAAPELEAEAAVGHYRAARKGRGQPDDPRSLWVAFGSDAVFRWPSLRMAAAQQIHQRATFVYLFTWESPAFGGVLGSCHALEIPFVFGSFDHPFVAPFAGRGDEASALSAAMRRAWVSFARTGHPGEGPAGWHPWDPQRRTTMVFGTPSRVVDGPLDEELAVWLSGSPLPGPEAASISEARVAGATAGHTGT